MNKLADLNNSDDENALSFVLPLIERAPDVARKVIGYRPFEKVSQLQRAIRTELLKLNEEEWVRLFKAHPELAPENPRTMTAESQSEQGRFGLTFEANAYKAELADLNARYHAKFGFPFIIALTLYTDMESVLREFQNRLANDRPSEIKIAIEQICAVSDARVHDLFDGVTVPNKTIPQVALASKNS